MIVGLDLSLASTGVCVLREGCEIVPKSILTKPIPCKEQRLTELLAEILAAIPYNAELVVIESPSFGSKGLLDQLWALNWMVRCDLWKAGIKVLMVAPTQLKKFVMGAGKGEKSLVLMNVLDRWGIRCGDDNQGDAVVLAKIGAAYLGLEECTINAQREVIAALKAPKVKKPRKKRGEAA